MGADWEEWRIMVLVLEEEDNIQRNFMPMKFHK